MTLRVFPAVEEKMHGRRDDKVMWERALRCFLVLLNASNEHASSDVSTKSFIALALNIEDLMHADVDHALINQALCSRLRLRQVDAYSPVIIDMTVLEYTGGGDTISTLFADTTSVSARHALFELVFDIAVLDVLGSMPRGGDHTVHDHVVTFRALLQAHDCADFFVHTFRVGPSSTVVIDAIRLFLLKRLAKGSCRSLSGSK